MNFLEFLGIELHANKRALMESISVYYCFSLEREREILKLGQIQLHIIAHII